jgi:hypothetical protein
VGETRVRLRWRAVTHAGQTLDPNIARIIRPLMSGQHVTLGHLPADPPDGQFAYCKIEHLDGDATSTVDLTIFPDQPNLLLDAGFDVYGPDPTKRYARGTPQHPHRPNVSADFRSAGAALYTVQVYSRDPVLPIDVRDSASASPR